MENKITVKSFTGPEARPYTRYLARLRIVVFREYPYLYDGTLEYETAYLNAFSESEDSVIVIAFDGDTIVGASTGLPMEDAAPEIRAPWVEQGADISRIFYYGESVLLPEYRGKGIGRQFFEQRERWARGLGRFGLLTFCAVIREPDHPLKPADYKPPHRLCERKGFVERKGCACRISWKEIQQAQESVKTLQFWSKTL